MTNNKITYKMKKLDDGRIGIIEYGTYNKRIKIHASKDHKTKTEFFAVSSENRELNSYNLEGQLMINWNELQEIISGNGKGGYRFVFNRSTNFLDFNSINNLMKFLYSKLK